MVIFWFSHYFFNEPEKITEKLKKHGNNIILLKSIIVITKTMGLEFYNLDWICHICNGYNKPITGYWSPTPNHWSSTNKALTANSKKTRVLSKRHFSGPTNTIVSCWQTTTPRQRKPSRDWTIPGKTTELPLAEWTNRTTPFVHHIQYKYRWENWRRPLLPASPQKWPWKGPFQPRYRHLQNPTFQKLSRKKLRQRLNPPRWRACRSNCAATQIQTSRHHQKFLNLTLQHHSAADFQ